MTAPTAKRPRGTALPRVAGLLFIVAGLADYGLITVSQAPTDPSVAFGNLLPTLAFAVLVLLVLPVAFLLLFIWLPRTPVNSVFLLLALGSFLAIVLKTTGPPAPQIVDVVVAILAVVAGVFVVLRREFPLVTGILFLIAMVAAHVVPYVLMPLSGVALRYLPLWAIAVAYALAGLALLIRPRRETPAEE